MKWELDAKGLAVMVAYKQGKLSSRAVGRYSDLSSMTVNRVLRGEGCGLSALLALATWMDEDPRVFVRPRPDGAK